MSIKNSNDTIRNRSRDLPICTAVPQPTALPRVPQILELDRNISNVSNFIIFSVNKLYYSKVTTSVGTAKLHITKQKQSECVAVN
jgi:hypothetical protein